MNKVHLLYFTASVHTLMIKVEKKHTPYYRSMEKLGECLTLNRRKGSEVYEVFIKVWGQEWMLSTYPCEAVWVQEDR